MSATPTELSPIDTDRFLASMAHYMVAGDEHDEARLLLSCSLRAELAATDWGVDYIGLEFSGPRKVYDLLHDEDSQTYQAFRRAAEAVMPADKAVNGLVARAQLVSTGSTDWRDEIRALIDGDSVDNQAVGFKASRTYEGLRFRSQSEIRIAEALDRVRVMYLPNCRGRVGSHDETRKTVEADFIVFLNGKWGVLEVDGEPFHPPERSAIEHERDRAFKYHGAAVVERFDAERCYNDADRVVAQFLTLLKRH